MPSLRMVPFYAVVVALSLAASAVVLIEGPTAWALAVAAAVTAWALIPRRPDAAPRSFVLLVWGLMFGELLPESMQLVATAVAFAGSLLVWASQPREARRGGRVVFWVAGILALYGVLLLAHPNVPSLEAGLLGYRLGVMALAGLVLGCAIPRHRLAAAQRTVIAALFAACLASLVLFLRFPALERSLVSRDADEYTALFGGEPRLQGIFAGPFHAALAGVLLVAWAVAARPKGLNYSKAARIAALVTGLVVVNLTAVRTAYIAVALVVIISVLLVRRPTAFLGRAAVLLGLGWVVYYAYSSGDSTTLSSIGSYSSDSRLLGRLPGYREGLRMVEESLYWGWGPGAAGDTLDRMFFGHRHVTPHNLALKIAVEAGLAGLLLWSAAAISWWRRTDRGHFLGQVGVLSVVGLLSFGITGSAVDALPLSFVAFLLAGLGVGPLDARDDVAVASDRDALAGDVVDDLAEVGR